MTPPQEVECPGCGLRMPASADASYDGYFKSGSGQTSSGPHGPSTMEASRMSSGNISILIEFTAARLGGPFD